ncbi:hypothetical protein BGZ57DRAFT_906212 [Hyaloscypha finlandica]|nr:hypothetical protein BGZ57DRAFT_906212 [Hyaloscypha finlandica]
MWGKSSSHPDINKRWNTTSSYSIDVLPFRRPRREMFSSEITIRTKEMSAAFAATLIGAALASPVSKSAIRCPIAMDGHVPTNSTLQIFDTTASPFSPKYSKGQNLTWSQIIKLLDVNASKFDTPGDRAIGVAISEQPSIFRQGGGKQQLGFRLAGLLVGNGSDAANTGVKTFHWSVQQDSNMKTNLTREYMNVWHERNDYDGNQFSFNTGIMIGQNKPTDSNVSMTGLNEKWKILNNKNDVIWTTGIAWDAWQNFAVTVDYVNQ